MPGGRLSESGTSVVYLEDGVEQSMSLPTAPPQLRHSLSSWVNYGGMGSSSVPASAPDDVPIRQSATSSFADSGEVTAGGAGRAAPTAFARGGAPMHQSVTSSFGDIAGSAAAQSVRTAQMSLSRGESPPYQSLRSSFVHDEDEGVNTGESGGMAPMAFARRLEAEQLAAQELAEIHRMVLAKSERLSEKEQSLQRSSIAMAETAGALRAHLREEVESLMRSSQRELQRKTAQQQRRLEEALQKTQDEFRRVVAWRREVRSMRDTVAANVGEHEKLKERLHDSQRRCAALADRERAQRQALQAERDRWEEERQAMRSQQQLLKRKVLQLQRSVSKADAEEPVATSTHSKERVRASSARTPQQQQQQQRKVARSQSRGRTRSSKEPPVSVAKAPVVRGPTAEGSLDEETPDSEHASEQEARKASTGKARRRRRTRSKEPNPKAASVEDASLPLLGAWWCLDTMTSGSSRNLWGYIVLLAETLGTNRAHQLLAQGGPRLQCVAACYVRRWSWRLLAEDVRGAWRKLACQGQDPSAAPRPDPSRNTLEWARQLRGVTRSNTGDACTAVELRLRERRLTLAPFDVGACVPALGGPLDPLREFLVLNILPAASCASVALTPEEASGRAAGVLAPLEVQRRLAAILWQDARDQLLTMESQLREGTAAPSSIQDVCRSLVLVAALSFAANINDTHAALRALLRLAAGHSLDSMAQRLLALGAAGCGAHRAVAHRRCWGHESVCVATAGVDLRRGLQCRPHQRVTTPCAATACSARACLRRCRCYWTCRKPRRGGHRVVYRPGSAPL